MAMKIMDYRTADLYLAAFLKAKGLRLLNKRGGGHGKLTFIFEDRADRENLVSDFFNNGMVNITAFKGAIQDLKTLLFSA